MLLCAGEKLDLPRRQIVVADDANPRRQKPINQIAADETSRTSDKGCLVRDRFHVCP
jgi:hypothetical protein